MYQGRTHSPEVRNVRSTETGTREWLSEIVDNSLLVVENECITGRNVQFVKGEKGHTNLANPPDCVGCLVISA